MNPWKALGIKPTDDTKIIKQAYARLLKNNKPDENPETFIKIHNAYKQCLKQATQSAVTAEYQHTPINQTNNTKQETTQNDNQGSQYELDKDHLSLTSESKDDEKYACQNDYVDALNQSWIIITQQTNIALDQMTQSDKEESWSFLTQSEELFDFEFKNRYHQHLFQKLVDFFQQPNSPTPLQRTHSLHFINRELNLLDRQDILIEEHHPDDIAKSIFTVLEKSPVMRERQLKWRLDNQSQTPLNKASALLRFIALFIDIFILGFIWQLIEKVDIGIIDQTNPSLAIVLLFIIFFSVIEASPFQGSIGKIICGLKVTSSEGQRMHYLQSLWRQLVLVFSIGLGIFSFIINLFLLKSGRFIHDRLSFTNVSGRYTQD